MSAQGKGKAEGEGGEGEWEGQAGGQASRMWGVGVQRVQVEFLHPHTIGLDIKGNFHRGLVMGVLLGFALALLVVEVALQLVEAAGAIGGGVRG